MKKIPNISSCLVMIALTVLALSNGLSAVDVSSGSAAEGLAGSKASLDGSAPSVPRQRAGAQEFSFQAEVNRLMDIIIHSLYSNKDVFLRELISNACDAMDKIRFLALTDPSLLGEGEDAQLQIQVSLDKEGQVLHIRDRGIGMTKDDLIKNLGTIAKSGTSAFLEQMQKGGDMNLIGQFGVGFYSVYLVADWVEVVSKHNDDKQYIWSSTADGSFNIIEDTENEPLGRGTLIKLHLRPEALEYAQEHKVRELIQRYSEFMNFPIYFQAEKEVEVPVEPEVKEGGAEEEVATSGEEDRESSEEESSTEGVADAPEEEEDEEEEVKETPATRKEKQLVWELVNDNKAIWLRKPSEVTKEEYEQFYKAVSKNHDEPLAFSHFKAEGDVEFKTVLYVPSSPPPSFFDKYYEKEARPSLKLYVRRVFISDTVTDLLPRFLSFIRGIIDSDTLPLNVSREMLQQHAALRTIKKKLVRKVLDIIKKLADDERQCKEQDEAEKEAAKEEQAAEKEAGKEAAGSEEQSQSQGEDKADKETAKLTDEQCKKYGRFWTSFGKAIKLGVIEDSTNRNRLAKLLRFHTSRSTDKLVSLDDYVAGMKEGQREIYFLTGQSLDEVKKSPFVERLLNKGYEVIYFTDVLDEYVMTHLMEYDDKKFADASKEDLRMSDRDEEEKKRDKELKEEFKDLTRWWLKRAVGEGAVSSVKVSNRLSTTPCVVVAGKYSHSANLERIQRAQALSSAHAHSARGQKVLEINPRHPLIKALKEKVSANEEDEAAVNAAKLLWDTALLESGFTLEDTRAFSQRIYAMAKDIVGVDAALDAVEEEAEEEDSDAVEETDEYEDAVDSTEDSVELGDAQATDGAEAESVTEPPAVEEPAKEKL